mgnify:CR=1 FL=1
MKLSTGRFSEKGKAVAMISRYEVMGRAAAAAISDFAGILCDMACDAGRFWRMADARQGDALFSQHHFNPVILYILRSADRPSAGILSRPGVKSAGKKTEKGWR